MSQMVRVPDKTHEALKQEADERDMSIGAVIEEKRKDAEKLDRITRNFEEHFQHA